VMGIQDCVALFLAFPFLHYNPSFFLNLECSWFGAHDYLPPEEVI